MTVDPAICAEWADEHLLSRESVHWIALHADPGDEHPIVTAVNLLRSYGQAYREASTAVVAFG